MSGSLYSRREKQALPLSGVLPLPYGVGLRLMVTSILFLTCALAPAQAGGGPEWMLTPRLSRAQELVYKGTFAEETLGRSVQFSRNYRIESRVFVLNALAQSNEVVLYTVLREPLGGTVRPAGMKLEEPGSVRLEPATLTAQGRVTLAGGRLLQVPLDGPPVLDCPAVVPVPNHRVALNQPWEIPEEGRPATVWTVVGTENLAGNPCLKLTGVQASDDWDRPRADRASWRREDKVWLSTRAGTITRMERVIELREAAHREPTQRTTTKYELESSIAYPGQLFDDRNREIAHARSFERVGSALLQDPAARGRRGYRRRADQNCKFYLDIQPPTPIARRWSHCGADWKRCAPGRAHPRCRPPPGAALATASPRTGGTGFRRARHHRQRGCSPQPRGRPAGVAHLLTRPRRAGLRVCACPLQDENPAAYGAGIVDTEDVDAARKAARRFEADSLVGSGKGLRLSYLVDARQTHAAGRRRRAGELRGLGIGDPGAVTEELRRWLKPLRRQR